MSRFMFIAVIMLTATASAFSQQPQGPTKARLFQPKAEYAPPGSIRSTKFEQYLGSLKPEVRNPTVYLYAEYWNTYRYNSAAQDWIRLDRAISERRSKDPVKDFDNGQIELLRMEDSLRAIRVSRERFRSQIPPDERLIDWAHQGYEQFLRDEAAKGQQIQ